MCIRDSILGARWRHPCRQRLVQWEHFLPYRIRIEFKNGSGQLLMEAGVADEKQSVGGMDAAIKPTRMYSRRLCIRPDSDSLIAFITPSNT